MNLADIPSITKVKKAIENLKALELPKYKEEISVDKYTDSIFKILHKEFGFMLNMKQPMQFNKFLRHFFRVRILDTFTNLDLIREHSYPPLEIVKMGRCNFPGYPVFYCSNNPGTALLEMVRNQVGNPVNFCVSKWELVKSNQELIFERFLQITLPNDNIFNLLTKDLENRINEPFEKSYKKRLSKSQEKGILEYLKYLDSCFITDVDYSISASLAHRTFYAKHKVKTDILIYPSVQTYYKGVNLAIHPNFVDNNLRLKRLYILSLNNFNLSERTMSVTFKKLGEIYRSSIIWRNIDLKDIKDKKIIIQDFGHPLIN